MPADGAVMLAEYVHKGASVTCLFHAAERFLGDLGQFTPRREACGEAFAIKRSAQQMPLQGEVQADQPKLSRKA